MNWKDWLYIPKNDKTAIASLVVVIAVLLLIFFIVNNRFVETRIDYTTPKDYQQWQSQLTQQLEEENNYQTQHKHLPRYQSKMKEGKIIELNSADTTQMKGIPGIGSGFANRIVKYRQSLGGFANIEQLNEVWGLDTYLYSQIVPYITLQPHHDSIYINHHSFERLVKHPYLNYKQVSAIVDVRERKGKIKSVKRLELLSEFSHRDLERLSAYLNFAE